MRSCIDVNIHNSKVFSSAYKSIQNHLLRWWCNTEADITYFYLTFIFKLNVFLHKIWKTAVNFSLTVVSSF